MSYFQRYQQLIGLLELYPQFDSQEAGLAASAETERCENSRFIIRCPIGVFEFHRCYWSQDQLVSQCDFSVNHAEMWRIRRLAALEIGNSLLNQEVTPNQ